ncbi:MAG: hypothetical protein ACR2KU_06215 [Gammaproteobacteria bacterium]
MGFAELLHEVDRLAACGQLRAAAEVLEESIAQSGRDPRLLRALGRLYLLEHRAHNAVSILQEALELQQRGRIHAFQVGHEEVSALDMDYLAEQDSAASGVRLQEHVSQQILDQSSDQPVSRGLIEIQRGPDTLSVSNYPPQPASRFDSTPGDHQSDSPNDTSCLQQDLDVPFENERQMRIAETKMAALGLDAFKEALYPQGELDFEVDDEQVLPAFDDVEFQEFPEELASQSAFYYPSDQTDEVDPYLVDIEELIDDISEDADEEPLPRGVTREQRALQVAAEFLERVGWDREHLRPLQDFFVRYGWSMARVALEREIEKGLDPEEFPIALRLREIWAENERYWTAFFYPPQAKDCYRVMSWSMAILIVRSVPGIPFEEELELFVENEFDIWYSSDSLRRQFCAFIKYLYFRVAGGNWTLHPFCPVNFPEPRSEDFDDASALGLTDLVGAERRSILMRLGVRIHQSSTDLDSRYTGHPHILAAIAQGDYTGRDHITRSLEDE